MGNNHSRKPKPINQLHLDGNFIKRYASASEAAKVTGANAANITSVCKGRIKKTKGFKWEYDNTNKEKAVAKKELNIIANEMLVEVNKYCVLEDGYAEIIVLWAMGTYFIDKINYFPRLIITAQTPGCGKSQVLKVLRMLTVNSKISLRPSAPLLYRLDKSDNPVRLIDEVDRWMKTSAGRDAIDLLNAGVEKGAEVEKIHPNTLRIEVFEVFMPLALAGIRLEERLEKTLRERSIILNVKQETGAKKLYGNTGVSTTEQLRSRLVKASSVLMSNFKHTEPPLIGSSRDQDVWYSLFACAELLGVKWKKTINQQYKKFTSNHEEQDERIKLLLNIKEIIDDDILKSEYVNVNKIYYIGSKILLDDLLKSDMYFWKDDKLDAKKLATTLKGFSVKTRRINVKNPSRKITVYAVDQLMKLVNKYAV